jgi:hypothetical protein
LPAVVQRWSRPSKSQAWGFSLGLAAQAEEDEEDEEAVGEDTSIESGEAVEA